MSDEKFILEYEKLLANCYCDCNEMNCIDNNSPRRILNIAKRLQQENQKYKEVINKAVEYIEKHLTDNGRFLMLNEWQVPDLLRILKEVE